MANTFIVSFRVCGHEYVVDAPVEIAIKLPCPVPGCKYGTPDESVLTELGTFDRKEADTGAAILWGWRLRP